MMYTIIIIVYLVGYLVSFFMLKVDHESENLMYTKGDRAASICLSLLSWLMITYILIITWIKKIGITGYWSRPVKPIKSLPE